jgi:DNA polymerase III alpha subunit
MRQRVHVPARRPVGPKNWSAGRKQLGYRALAITDECTMAGVVRAHVAAKEAELKPLIIGSRSSSCADAPFTLIVLAQSLNGYGNLCASSSRSSADVRAKGDVPPASRARSPARSWTTASSSSPPTEDVEAGDELVKVARWMLYHFTGRCWLAVELLQLLDDEIWLHKLRQVRRADRYTASRHRRCALPRALAQGAAGRDDSHACRPAIDRVRRRATAERRATPPHSTSPGADLPG